MILIYQSSILEQHGFFTVLNKVSLFKIMQYSNTFSMDMDGGGLQNPLHLRHN